MVIQQFLGKAHVKQWKKKTFVSSTEIQMWGSSGKLFANNQIVKQLYYGTWITIHQLQNNN